MPTPTAWTTEAAAILEREQKMSSKTSDDDRAPATAEGYGRAFGKIMQRHPKADVRLVNDILRQAWAEAAARPDSRAVEHMTDEAEPWHKCGLRGACGPGCDAGD